MLLNNVLRGVGLTDSEVEVKRVIADSREVKRGDLFVALEGRKNNGHTFIDNAIEKGAVAVVGTARIDGLKVPYIRVENGRLAWAKLIANKYGNPEKHLKFVGVTGTDGKTTTANLIYEFLKESGYKVGLISTVTAYVGNKSIDTGLHTSTPDPDELWMLLHKMKNVGVEYVVLETTSHGIDQERFGDISFELGVLTNVASDHIDYHKTVEDYARTKAKLFERSRVAVLHKKTQHLNIFRKAASEKLIYCDRLTEIRKTKYLMVPNLMQEFEMMVYGDWFKVKTSLLGEFNQENILLAARSALSLGVKMETIVVALSKFEGVAGRFNIVKNSLGINIVIDFAHTEQGVGAVLKLVRENLLTDGNQLIVMLGSNGERDRTKRAPMAKMAVTWADKVIITNEDPRNEDPTQIYEDMVKGCVEKMEKVSRVDDRREAIEKALRMAKKGDWVLLLGKGHERSMNIKGVEVRWNELAEVRKLLLKLKN